MSYLKETTQPCSREVSKVKRVQTDSQTHRRTDWRQLIGVQKGSTEPWVEFCLQVILIYFFGVGCRKNDLFLTSSIVLISVKSKKKHTKIRNNLLWLITLSSSVGSNMFFITLPFSTASWRKNLWDTFWPVTRFNNMQITNLSKTLIVRILKFLIKVSEKSFILKMSCLVQ